MAIGKQLKVLLAAGALCVSAAAQAATVDVVQAPTGYFVPTDGQKYDAPYYRWYGEDWGWTHNAIGGTINNAWLMISAFDVDHSSGEVDNIYADNNGVQTLLGHLEGADDIWNFTFFQLSSDFFDDINAGLKLWLVIDSTNDGWAVTLAKSQLCVNADPNNYRVECAGNPTPGVPEPGSMALLGAGLAGLAALRRRKTA